VNSPNDGTPHVARGQDQDAREEAEGEKKDIRAAQENVRKARDEDAMDAPADAKRTGNRPRFDRDR